MQCTSVSCELIGFVKKNFQIYKSVCNAISDDPDKEKICSNVERHQAAFDNVDKIVSEEGDGSHPKLKRDYLSNDRILYTCEQCDRCYFSPERPRLPWNENKDNGK